MLVIRNIKEEDIEAIVDINISCWKKSYAGIVDNNYLENMDREKKISNMKRAMLNNSIIVAQDDEKIVGFCRYIANNGYSPECEEVDSEIMALYVAPEFQQKGIGSKLIEYVLEELKKDEKNKVIIWCLKANTTARLFYTKMGGTVYKERKLTIEDKEYDEIAYVYDI